MFFIAAILAWKTRRKGTRMAKFFSRGRLMVLAGLILLALGGLLYQMLAPSTAADVPRPTATPLYTAHSRAMATARPTGMAQETATAQATARPTGTAQATAAVQPTATPKRAAADDATRYSVEIRYAAQCDDYNHVGNAWTQAFYVDGEEVDGRVTRTLAAGESLTLETVITDADNSPDIGKDQRTVTLTEDTLTNGTSITATVEVRENRGRYAGNVAVWTVAYTITPIE